MALKIAAFLAGAACALLCFGCASFTIDETASGGGKVALETYHPCSPPGAQPVGGNTGEVPQDDARGGSARTEYP